MSAIVPRNGTKEDDGSDILLLDTWNLALPRQRFDTGKLILRAQRALGFVLSVTSC